MSLVYPWSESYDQASSSPFSVFLTPQSPVQENAVVLLSTQRRDKQWSDSFEPYWRSLPGPNSTLFCKEMFTARDKALLQDNDLVSTLPLISSSVHEAGMWQLIHLSSHHFLKQQWQGNTWWC